MTSSDKIHPTAIIAPGAKLAADAAVGPYTIIGEHVRIGAGTRVASHVVIEGHTQIGERCTIYPGVCIGMDPQDKKFKDCDSQVLIGNENIIREYVTIHPGTTPGAPQSSRHTTGLTSDVAAPPNDGARTVIGERNMLMVGVHVAHDCALGNDIVIANSVAIAGFVTIEDNAMIGGMSAIHQFVRVGKFSMIGGVAKVVMDIPPFSVCDGHPACFYGVNTVGLKRAGYSSERILEIKKALKILYGSSLRLAAAVEKVKGEFAGNPDIGYLLSFNDKSKRGITRSLKSEKDSLVSYVVE